MPTTEIAQYPLVKGSDIFDPTNDTAIAFKEGFDIVMKQDGAVSYFLGMRVDKPDWLEAMINWDDISSHYKWREHPDHASVAERSMSVFSGGGEVGQMYHSDFHPYEEFIEAMSAPVTEIIRFYFNDAPPATSLEAFEGWRQAHARRGTLGLIASAAGVTYEELKYEGVKGKAVVMLVGWQSMEAHEASLKDPTLSGTDGLLFAQAEKYERYCVRFVR